MKNVFYDITSAIALRDRLHSIAKNFETAFPDNFNKSGIIKCEVCGGVGILVMGNEEITFWEQRTYCKPCKGIGYIGFQRVYENYLCECNGVGKCEKCNGSGLIDWITNAMGG